MASGSADAGPGVKRRKTTECLDALFADCDGDGFQLEFQPDAAANETNLRQITADLRARVHGEIDSWQLAEPLDEYNKNVVLIVARTLICKLLGTVRIIFCLRGSRICFLEKA